MTPSRRVPPAFGVQIDAAMTGLVRAEDTDTQAVARQTLAGEQIQELGRVYHPYGLVSGAGQSVERVDARFAAVWARLADLADAADLPTQAREHLAKAQRLTVS